MLREARDFAYHQICPKIKGNHDWFDWPNDEPYRHTKQSFILHSIKYKSYPVASVKT